VRAELLPDGLALIGTLAVDRPLNLEQRIDAAHDLKRQRRDHRCLFALGFAPSVFHEIRHDEERAPGVDPARGFEDIPGTSSGRVELAISAIGVGLEYPSVVGQVRLGMLA
jgi:hypothetical protein